MLRSFHYFRQHAAHVRRVDEEDQSPMSADTWLAEDACTLGFELGFRGVDFGHFEADMVLTAERVLLEEFRNGRVLAQRLDQLDLRVGRIDEAHAYALRGEVECLPVRLRPEHIAVHIEALGDRWS